MKLRTGSDQFLPSVMLVTAAAGWGLFWIPLRKFEAAGLDAGWAALGQFVAPALILAPFALILAIRGKPTGLGRWKTAFLTGGAFALYADSLLLTDVARALILFFVSPAWSSILEVWFMKRRVTASRIIAIALGLSGLYVILGGDGSLPIPRNAGDWMALASGFLWACGSTRIRMTQDAGLFENVFSFFAFGAVVSLALALLPVEALGSPPEGSEIAAFLPWLLLVALVFLIPASSMQLYGARLVDPGRVGILLQTEAVFGIGSAAILTAEPFGWQEAIGSMLVFGAALAEVLPFRAWRQPDGASGPGQRGDEAG